MSTFGKSLGFGFGKKPVKNLQLFGVQRALHHLRSLTSQLSLVTGGYLTLSWREMSGSITFKEIRLNRVLLKLTECFKSRSTSEGVPLRSAQNPWFATWEFEYLSTTGGLPLRGSLGGLRHFC
jgi:hypothetical protein